MKAVIANIFILLSINAFSQVEILSSDIQPLFGDTFRVILNEFVSPGDSGENVVWDFSNMTPINSYRLDIKDPNNTSNGSDFPDATIVWYNQGNYSYLNFNSNEQSINGLITASKVKMTYSNPEDLLRFPITYEKEYTDRWSLSFVNGVEFARKGVTNVDADAFGTLITPVDTYKNAMRLHIKQEYYDSSMAGFFNYVNDQYMWYAKGVAYPIVSTYTLKSFQGTFSGTQIITTKAVPSSLKQLDKPEISVYPNPATSVISLQLKGANAKQCHWSIYNVQGNEISIGEIDASAFVKLDLNIADLQNGLYVVVVTIDDRKQVFEFVKN
jgi:hypothetical protein